MNIIARTHMGAIDLYNGVPDLKGAKIIKVHNNYNIHEDYETMLIIEDKNGTIHTLTIAKA